MVCLSVVTAMASCYLEIAKYKQQINFNVRSAHCYKIIVYLCCGFYKKNNEATKRMNKH